MPYQAILNDKKIDVDIEKRRPMLRVSVGESTHTITEARCPAAGDFEVTIDGHIHRGWRYATADEVYVRMGGHTYIIGVPQFGGAGGAGGASENEIKAEMPGTMVSHHCKEGEAVTAGQKLVTIESMKLQVGLVAPRDGTVAKIHYAANATFDRGVALVSLVPLEKKA
jgi:biotin carboxyl carrier protein